MRKSFDRVADIYDETRRMPPHVVEKIMDNIAGELDPAAGEALELGIGTGRVAVPLAGRGFRIVGVDVADKMLMRLRRKLSETCTHIHPVRADVRALPFTDGSFGAVLAVHVFHLIEDIPVCIQEARRVLKRGGRLLFGGEQRLMRYIQQELREEYAPGITEDIVSTLTNLGIKLTDQAEVERRVKQSVLDMGGEISPVPPVEWDYEITCAEVVERIERRVASYLWDVPEEALENLVGRVRSALQERVGPPSTTIRFRRRFEMMSARFSS